MTPGAIAPSRYNFLSENGPEGRIEAEFGRNAAKLERIARFLRSKNAPKFS
jgi:hypothetical protein